MAKRRPSGDGMVRKRGDGRWEGRIVVGHKSNGDSIFRYISAPTQKELSAKLRQLTEAYKGVDLTEESNMSLSVWLGKWLAVLGLGTVLTAQLLFQFIDSAHSSSPFPPHMRPRTSNAQRIAAAAC